MVTSGNAYVCGYAHRGEALCLDSATQRTFEIPLLAGPLKAARLVTFFLTNPNGDVWTATTPPGLIALMPNGTLVTIDARCVCGFHAIADRLSQQLRPAARVADRLHSRRAEPRSWRSDRQASFYASRWSPRRSHSRCECKPLPCSDFL